jgi:hypothetical protein
VVEPVVLILATLPTAFSFPLSAALIAPAAIVVASLIDITGVVVPVATEIGAVPVTLVTVPVGAFTHSTSLAAELTRNTLSEFPIYDGNILALAPLAVVASVPPIVSGKVPDVKTPPVLSVNTAELAVKDV